MKNILIAIDYALSAQRVAQLGYDMTKAMNAKITLLHAIEHVEYYSSTVYDPIMGFGGFSNTFFLDAEGLSKLEAEAEQFLIKTVFFLGDDKIQTKVIHGNVVDSIFELVKQEHIDLIVVGTHGRHSVEEFFLGSSAHKLIQRAAVPVLVIPSKLK